MTSLYWLLKKFVTLVICNDFTLHLANYNAKTSSKMTYIQTCKRTQKSKYLFADSIQCISRSTGCCQQHLLLLISIGGSNIKTWYHWNNALVSVYWILHLWFAVQKHYISKIQVLWSWYTSLLIFRPERRALNALLSQGLQPYLNSGVEFIVQAEGILSLPVIQGWWPNCSWLGNEY